MISKLNLKLLDPNQEHQALIPLVDHLKGVNRWCANQMPNNAELKAYDANLKLSDNV